jgi:hypothetical protein
VRRGAFATLETSAALSDDRILGLDPRTGLPAVAD